MTIGDLLRGILGGGSPAGRDVVRVDFEFTLMRVPPGGDFHVSSGTRPKTWYLETSRAPSTEAIGDALLAIFRLENARLQASEPNDPNYLAPMDYRYDVVSFAVRGPYPWEADPGIVWETSSCFCVDRPDRIVPFAPTAFTNQVLLRRIADGAIEPGLFRAIALPRYASDGDLVDKIIADPGSFLELGLQMAEATSGWPR